jgi:hypothetical protein
MATTALLPTRSYWRLAAAALAASVVGLSACSSAPVRQAPLFYGLSVPSADPLAFDSLGASLGCAPAVNSDFWKLDSDVTPERLERLSASGATPMVTLEPWLVESTPGDPELAGFTLQSVIEGDHDDDLWRIAGVMATYDRAVYLRFAHELNGDWYPWAVGVNTNTSDRYVRAWRHVHDLFTRAGADQVTWVWSPNVVTNTGRDFAEAYPGDDYVDVLGLTGYGGLAGADASETFEDSLDELEDVSEAPVLLAETGASGDKRRWIESLPELLAEHERVIGLVWFSTTPESTGATGDYRLDDSEVTLDAFRGLVTTLPFTCGASGAAPA